MENSLRVYLSGEIHTNWREEIQQACEAAQVPVEFLTPELNHEASDSCGESILGKETDSFWRDHKAAKINLIRHHFTLRNSDVVVVKFGDKYRQWNAAFDAGVATAEGIPLITLHEESLDHALKEVDSSALATARTVVQVVEILRYITKRSF